MESLIILITICFTGFFGSPLMAGETSGAVITTNPVPSPTPAPFLKKLSLTLGGGPFLNDPFTASFLIGLTANYQFSEKSGLQLDLWDAQSRNSDTDNYFANVVFQEPDHNSPVGYYGAHYTWTPLTSTIAAKLGFLGNLDIPFAMGFSPGLGATILKSAEITAPPSYVPPTGTTQITPTAALDVYQTFRIFNHWSLRLDFVNHLYSEQVYSSQNGSPGISHLTYNNAILVGIGYSCTMRPQKKKSENPNTGDQTSENPTPAAEVEEDIPAPEGVSWCW